MRLKLTLANGNKLFMESTLEDFMKKYLDESGNYKSGYIEMKLKNMKEDPITLIFTHNIVTVEEIKS